jgi:hypothetical protein
MGGIPFAAPMYREGGDRISEILARQGENAARGALMSGQAWGNAVGQLGQIAGQAVQQIGEQKELKKRDAALAQFIESGAWQDPQQAVIGATRILGPRDGPRLGEALIGAAKLSAGAKDPAESRQALQMVARGWPAVPAALRPGMWGNVRQMAQVAGFELPEQYTPELDPMIAEFGGATKPVGTREIRTRQADGSEQVQIVEDKPGQEFVSAPTRPNLSQIEAEAEARARGTRRGAPPQPSGGENYVIEEPGPNGTVIKRLATADELRRGVTVAPRATGQKLVTGAERTALSFYNRAKTATDDIGDLEDRISKRSYASQTWNANVPNVMKSEDEQLYRNRQRSFTEARLRKESGAAIPETEFENDRVTYWAMPGDSAAVIEQKRKLRAGVLDGLRYSAGRAYDEYYGEMAPKDQSGGPPPPNLPQETQSALDKLFGAKR